MSVWSKLASGATGFGLGLTAGTSDLTAILAGNKRDKRAAERDKRAAEEKQKTTDAENARRNALLVGEQAIASGTDLTGEAWETVAQGTDPTVASAIASRISVANSERLRTMDSDASSATALIKQIGSANPRNLTEQDIKNLNEKVATVRRLQGEARQLDPSVDYMAELDGLAASNDPVAVGPQLDIDQHIRSLTRQRRLYTRNVEDADFLLGSDDIEDQVRGLRRKAEANGRSEDFINRRITSLRRVDYRKQINQAINRQDDDRAVDLARQSGDPRLLDEALAFREQVETQDERQLITNLTNRGHYQRAYDVAEGSNDPSIRQLAIVALGDDDDRIRDAEVKYNNDVRSESIRLQEAWMRKRGFIDRTSGFGGGESLSETLATQGVEIPKDSFFRAEAVRSLASSNSIGAQRMAVLRETGAQTVVQSLINTFEDLIELDDTMTPEEQVEQAKNFQQRMKLSRMLSVSEKQQVMSYLNATFGENTFDEVLPGTAFEMADLQTSPLQRKAIKQYTAGGIKRIRDLTTDEFVGTGSNENRREFALREMEAKLELETVQGVASVLTMRDVDVIIENIRKATVQADRESLEAATPVAPTDASAVAGAAPDGSVDVLNVAERTPDLAAPTDRWSTAPPPGSALSSESLSEAGLNFKGLGKLPSIPLIEMNRTDRDKLSRQLLNKGISVEQQKRMTMEDVMKALGVEQGEAFPLGAKMRISETPISQRPNPTDPFALPEPARSAKGKSGGPSSPTRAGRSHGRDKKNTGVVGRKKGNNDSGVVTRGR